MERDKRVAFIGTSNWALDPAKMNRGVMVTRGEPGQDELILSARGICSAKEDDNSVQKQLERYFYPLSQAYLEICKKQKRQFFGLRDFYRQGSVYISGALLFTSLFINSLIKMLYWMCDKSQGHGPTLAQLKHAVKRNFGGLDSEDLDPFEEFHSAIGHNMEDNQNFLGVDDEVWYYIHPRLC